MLKNSLSKQFLIWIIILSAFILSGSIIIFFIQNLMFTSYTETQDEIREKYSYVEAIDETINIAVFDFSRFVISKDTSYIENQLQYEQTMGETIERLQRISSTEKDESFLNVIKAFNLYYFEDKLVSAALYVEANETDEVVGLVNNSEFNDKINQIRNDSIAYKAYLSNETSKATQTFDRNRQLIGIGIFLYVALSLLTLIVIVRMILKRIGLPLRELTEAANQLSAGNRNITINELDRNDELGILSKTFNRMIRKIKESELKEQQLNDELKVKNKDLEQVVYIASHDLRSPLINIQGFNKELQASFAEIQSTLQSGEDINDIKQKISLLMEEDIPEAFDFIISSTNKMDLLLNALLRLSRIGREKPNMEPIDMNQLVAKVVKNFEFKISEEKTQIEIDELPEAIGDASLIDQVVSNLFGNALKFPHPDRIGFVKLSGYEEKERVVYCVEDNGIGISEQYQQQIFNLFEKIDPSKSGEGLGLTIVCKILERHGGDIWIESELDKYSKFYFSLQKAKKVN